MRKNTQQMATRHVMNPKSLEDYLQKHTPLSKAMQVGVVVETSQERLIA
jgi:hypothetical protein